MPLMLLLAAGSGVAALIYEVVWFQLLELALGSTAFSLAVILATFMGGTCLGSLLFPRLVPANRNPLRIYAAIELGIVLFAILSLRLLPFVGGILQSRALVAAICLLPPTLLMGATLPALARALDDPPALGLLYGANIAGAVLGCLLSGFYLLRVFDVSIATCIAVALNIAVALLAFFSHLPARTNPPSSTEPRPAGSALIYLAIGLSGFCALASESLWTRTLGLLLGASVYTLSIILAVFLTGLGIGSAVGSILARNLADPRRALGWCQLLLAAAIAWTAYNLNASLPYWPINPSIASGVWFNFQLDLDRAFWALLPPTLLWGAGFPLALAAAYSKQASPQKHDSAELFAGIYAANTLGAIIGAIAASLLFITWIGSQHAQQLLIALSAIAGLCLLLPASRLRSAPPLALASLALAALLIQTVPPISKVLIAHGRYAATWVGKGDIVYAREGLNSSVAVTSFPDHVLTFHVAGKIQASNVPRDMRLQRMLGHLTTLTAANPRSILVIGCGAGITAGAVSVDPRVAHETIAEIEPLVPQAAAQFFGDANFDVLHNPKVQVRIDDGRHYLLTTKERFDGITVDPLDPWVKGAANLYTQEFLDVMKQHLNPGGTVTMYIQLFETDLDAVKSAVATFFEVFPNATIWGNPYQGQGHDMVLLGQVEPLHINLDDMDRRLTSPAFDQLKQSLAEVGMNSTIDLFATYAGRAPDLAPWLKDAPINHDRNLRMQYLAGLGLDLDEAAAIYAELLTFRRFPTNLFTSTEGRVYSLRDAIARER